MKHFLRLAVWMFASSYLLANSISNTIKVSFVKGTQIYVADLGGKNMRELTQDSSIKRQPKWSPDGKQIVYWDLSVGKQFLGDLVVIDSESGKLISRLHVTRVNADGIQIDGMRAIENIGWFDGSDVFATGSVNPYAAEYRITNIKNNQTKSFSGFGFATCQRRGLVAFWLAIYPQQQGAAQLVTSADRNKPLFELPDAKTLPTLDLPLSWNRSCDSLAFLDPRLPAQLVVVSSATKDLRLMRLPERSASDPIQPWANGFLIGEKEQLSYQPPSASVEDTPESTRSALQKSKQARESTMRALGDVVDADWWSSDWSL